MRRQFTFSHSFQKTSSLGIKTPQREIDIIKSRLKDAEELHKQWLKSQIEKGQPGEVGQTRQAVKFTRSGGNVFADLGLENPEDLLHKSHFVSMIDRVVKGVGLLK